MVSDIVLLKPLPEEIRNSVFAYIGCLAGAVTKNEYLGAIRRGRFSGSKDHGRGEPTIRALDQ